MIVGPRQGVLTADLLQFSHTTVCRVCREWSKKQKTSSERQFCKQRGQWRRARLVKVDRKMTVTQITTHYNSGTICRSPSLNTQWIGSTWIGYNSRRPISVKNKSNKFLINKVVAECIWPSKMVQPECT